jgi:hypothetical protein
MKKVLAMGALLLSSAAVLVTPAAAREWSNNYNSNYNYDSRVAPQRFEDRFESERRAERLRRERLRRERERREWFMRHHYWDRY